MKTKKKMRYLELFIAAVVAFTMLPTNVLEVKAGSDICTCGHPYDKHSSGLTCMITGCSCKGFSPSSSSSSSSTSTVTTTVASEESSEPTMSYEDYKRKVEEEAIEKRKKLFELNSKVYSNGQEIKSTLPGAYEAESVKGIAVVTPKEELERGLGLSSGEYVTVETWDVNKRKSANAAASLEYAAGSIEIISVMVSIHRSRGTRPALYCFYRNCIISSVIL